LDCDHGLGIVSFDKPENKLNFTREQIAVLTYEQFNEHRKEWLNLKEPSYFFDYFGIKK
jgi:hypothetical protein